MKHKSKLLAVMLALTVALSGLVATALTVNADDEEIAYRDPYAVNRFTDIREEDFYRGDGLVMDDHNGANVGNTHAGDVFLYSNCDFGETGALSVKIGYVGNSTKCKPDATIVVVTVDEEGEQIPLAIISLPATGNSWNIAPTIVQSDLMAPLTGVQIIAFGLMGEEEGENIADLYTFQFSTYTTAEEPQVPEEDEGEGEGEEPKGPTYTDDIYFGLVATEQSGGLKIPDDPGDNTDGIGGTYEGAWFMVPYDFGTDSAVGIKMNYCNNSNRCGTDSKVAIWVGGKSEAEGGTLLTTIDLTVTGDNWASFGDVEAAFNSITGQQNIYFVLSANTDDGHPYVANFNHFQFAVVAAGEEEPPVTGGEEEPPVTDGDKDPVGPGPGKTGDAAMPISVMALLAVAAAGIVVLRKKEVNQ